MNIQNTEYLSVVIQYYTEIFSKFNNFRTSMSRLMTQFQGDIFKEIPQGGNSDGWLRKVGNLLPYDILRISQILVGASLKFSTYKKKKIDDIEDEYVEEMNDETKRLNDKITLSKFLNSYSKFTYSFDDKPNHLLKDNPNLRVFSSVLLPFV